MRLRPYAPDDWTRLCEIHDAARRDELSAAGLSDAFLTLEQTAQNEGLFDGEVVVAEVDRLIQGFAAFTEGELTWLYVEPRMYRQGVGRALLRQVVAACDGDVQTEVLVGNEAALALYLAEGFTLVQRTDGHLAGHEAFAASGYLLRRHPDRGAT
jgi:ribosomal protein S18 acetylase RimI-like enzyme